MITEICREIRNWFDFDHPKWSGEFTISDGTLIGFEGKLQEGQYFRIKNSIFNDGVHQFPAETLHDEIFKGEVWAMAIPEDFIALADEIEAWVSKYQGVNSVNMSPYNSESFGGYSYSKSGGGSADGGSGGGAGTWQNAYAKRLRPWRKI